MDSTKHTREEEVISVDKNLDKYKSQPLPQHKTDMILRYKDSAKKAAQELKEHMKNQGSI